MLASLLGHKSPAVELIIELDSDIVFVTPKEYGQAVDPVLSGVVRMTVFKAGYVAKAIKVDLRGVANVQGDLHFGYETTTTLHKTLELEMEASNEPGLGSSKASRMLELGEHAFSFAFTIPSDTACWQKCPWGRVRHQLQASLDFVDRKDKIVSETKEIYITGNVTGVGVPPIPFHQFIQHISDDLGPLSITFSSPYLTVASLVLIKVDFLSPPEAVEITSIDTFISQTYTVTSSNTGKTVKVPPHRHALRKVDPNGPAPGADGQLADMLIHDPRPLHLLDKETQWTHKMFCRIPTEESVRPSTVSGAKTPIKVEHTIVCSVTYRYRGEDKTLPLGRPVMMRSCCSLVDDLRVPPYQEEEDSIKDEPAMRKYGRGNCFCQSRLGQARDEEAYRFGRSEILGKGPAVQGDLGDARQGNDGFRRWDDAEVARRRLHKSPAAVEHGPTSSRRPDEYSTERI